MLVSFLPTQSFALSNTEISALTTKEITIIGLDLAKTSLSANDVDSAKIYSKFTTNFYGNNFQSIKEINSNVANDVHLSILDIHTAIGTDPNEAIIDTIENIQLSLSKISIDQTGIDPVIVNLLIVGDEQFQISITDNDDSAYLLAQSLITRATELYSTQTHYDERLRLELDSFFDELVDLVEQRESFVTVATLITAIQKDLLETESVSLDHKDLYNTIRQLYVEMLEALSTGDYVSAEDKAIEAYLENFEYLEPDIGKVDEELLYTLEINMREDLRNMIKDEVDYTEIEYYVKEVILPQLHTAEELVTEYHQKNPQLVGMSNTDLQKDLKEMGDATEEQKTGVRGEIDFIRDTLQEMLIFYESGDQQAAFTAARTAYLDSYEFVEIPLREIAPDFTLEVEYQFAELRNLINDGADIEEIREIAIGIKRNLDESERLVSGTGALAPTIAFSSSFAIIFREGLESVLILGAILTYLEASRNNKFKPYVYYGIVAAIGATAVTWFIASYVIEISGASRELIEAVAALSATAVLFYVSFWILNKIEHKKWMEFVKAKVWQATTTGSVMVFVMLSFFTVYREGFETVLFYQAMFGFAKYMEAWVGLGFVLGIVSLFVVYIVFRKLGKRLPLKVLFGLTMGIGAYLSIAFLGNAIRELQIIDIVPYTGMIGIIPRLDINLAAMTGIYPTLETLIGQIVLLGVYLAASSYVLILRPRREQKVAAMRKSRGMDNVE